MPKVRVRFSPSPTGFIHVGNARTALLNYLFAKKQGGEFVLRVKDTSVEYKSDELLDRIFEDLRWLKISWDEGPNNGGQYGPYRQSLRSKIYTDRIKTLMEKGLVYPCYCSVEELEHIRNEQLRKGEPPRYDNRGRYLTEAKKLEYEKQGRKPVWRFKVEPEVIHINDIVRGDMSFDTSLMGDFVVMKSDQTPTFKFSVAVDDGEMKITHVIRGEDHLANTPYHILLFRALGYPIPTFWHLGLLKMSDNQQISKRDLHDFFAIAGLREKGYLPESIQNYLVSIGQSIKQERNIVSFDELINKFELPTATSSSTTFDMNHLNWFSSHYIRIADLTRITDLIIPYLKENGLLESNLSQDDYEYLVSIVDVVRNNVYCLEQMVDYIAIFFNDDITIPEKLSEKLLMTDSQNILNAVDITLHEEQYLTEVNISFQEFCDHVFESTSIRGKVFYQTIRWALTGLDHGPELKDIYTLLSREKIRLRIKRVLAENV